MKKGVELKSVNLVITFKQKSFMKKYIDFDTMKRAQSETQFEKEFYKLTVNAVIGKTTETVRKRHNVKLCNESEHIKMLEIHGSNG